MLKRIKVGVRSHQECPGFNMTHDWKYFCCGLWMKPANDSNAYCNSRFSIALLTIYIVCCSVKFLLYAELSQNLQMQDLRSQMTVTPSPNPPPASIIFLIFSIYTVIIKIYITCEFCTHGEQYQTNKNLRTLTALSLIENVVQWLY